MNRRTMLKAAGIAIALPNLEIFAEQKKAEKIRRFVGVAGPLGVYCPTFFPQGEGKNYKLSKVTKHFEPYRDKITFFKNLDHGINGGHQGIHTLFSGVKLVDANSNPVTYHEKNISLDQKIGDTIGYKTRFHSLSVSPAMKPGGLMNTVTWTKNGIAVPRIENAGLLFNKLFKQDSKAEITAKTRKANIRSSILDAVMGQSRAMNSRIGKADQEKMDQYFTSIREVEMKIQTQKKWYGKEKPQVKELNTRAEDQIKLFPIFYDLLHLALVTDSTRSAVFHIPFGLDLKPLGIDRGHHGCSHHGKNPGAVADVQTLDEFNMKQIARFLGKLKESNILDDTTVVYGSGMSNGSSHSNKCLPIMVAGGGYNHGEHKIYSEDPNKKTMLCNLYLTILQDMGVEVEKFSNSTGTINGFHRV